MAGIVDMLRASDPLLTLRSAADGVCRSCPHDLGGVCEGAEKVARYDAGVLRLTGLESGEALRWSALSALVRERILVPGRLGEVCGDCQWYGICAQAAVQ